MDGGVLAEVSSQSQAGTLGKVQEKRESALSKPPRYCPRLDPEFYFSGFGVSTQRMQQRGATRGRGVQDGENPGEGTRHPHPHLDSFSFPLHVGTHNPGGWGWG